jgi:hypothetical protein
MKSVRRYALRPNRCSGIPGTGTSMASTEPAHDCARSCARPRHRFGRDLAGKAQLARTRRMATEVVLRYLAA